MMRAARARGTNWDGMSNCNSASLTGSRSAIWNVAVDLQLALRDVEHARLSASIHTVLGTNPSPGWALLSFDSFSVESEYNSYDTWNSPDTFAEVKVASTEPSVPGFLRYGPYTSHMDNTMSGSFWDLNIVVPLSAAQIQVKLHDYDTITSNDEIGTYDGSPFASYGLAQMQAVSGCGFQYGLKRGVRRWWGWWDYSTRRVTTARVRATLYSGASMEAKLDALNKASKVLTEAWSPLLDPNDASSYWTATKFYVENIGYLLSGLFGDDPSTPVSGLWAWRLRNAHSGNQLAPGPGADTTSVYSWNMTVVNLQVSHAHHALSCSIPMLMSMRIAYACSHLD